MRSRDVPPIEATLVRESFGAAIKSPQVKLQICTASPSHASITSSWSKYSLAASSALTYSVKVSVEGASSLPCHLALT